MSECHACGLLQFGVVFGQGIGVEEQSLGRKAAVNAGKVLRAMSLVPTADSPPADDEPSPPCLLLNSQARIQASLGQGRGLELSTTLLSSLRKALVPGLV